MTSLATGSSATVTLRDDGKCTVTTNGGDASVVETVAGVSTTHAFGPRPMRMAFGPYSEGASLVITNTSAVLDYDSPQSDVRYARDSSGNVTGLVGPDGDVVYNCVYAKPASGDTTGATDRANLQSAIDSAAAGPGRVWVAKGNYIVDADVDMAANVHVEFEPGTVIKMRDSFTVTATLTSGVTTVPVSSTAGIVVGMYVGDEAGDLDAGTPFGSIPWGVKVSSVGTNSIVLSSAPTASVSATLRMYPNKNCIRATEVDGWSLVCAGGWATLDGNISHAYPWPHSSLDNTRNAMRVVSCNDWLADGIEGANAFWHGLIAVGRMEGVRIPRYRGVGNGFRGIHFHSEAVTGDTTPEEKNIYFGDIEVKGNGLKSFYTRQYSERNSGCFVVFNNSRNIQIQSVRAIDERGLGMHLTGATGAFATAGDYSREIQIGQVSTDNCNVGFGLYNGIRKVQVGSVTVRGSHFQIASCATLDAANTDTYYVDDNGTMQTVKTRTVQLPVGSIAAYGIREGFWVYATDSTGFSSDGSQVWSVSEGAGAGGTDLIEVFDPVTESASPYTTVVGSATVQFCGHGAHGVYFDTDIADGVIQDIYLGSVHVDGAGRTGIYSTYSSSESRYLNIHFGNVVLKYCGRYALYLSSLNGLCIDNLHTTLCGQQKMDNSGGSSSGGASNSLLNVVNFQIKNFTRYPNPGWQDYQEALRCDDKCRNGHIYPIALSATVGAGLDVMNILTTAGAGDNGNGFTGPIYIHNPRNSNGALIAVNTVATENQITRTDANACIRVVPTDTP